MGEGNGGQRELLKVDTPMLRALGNGEWRIRRSRQRYSLAEHSISPEAPCQRSRPRRPIRVVFPNPPTSTSPHRVSPAAPRIPKAATMLIGVSGLT